MGQSSSRQRGFYPPPPPFAPTYGYGYPPATAYPTASAYAPAPVYGHILPQLPQQSLFVRPEDSTRRRRRRHRSSRKRRHDEYQDDDAPDPVIPSRAGTEIHVHNDRVQPGPSILRRSVGAHTPYPSGNALPQDDPSESGHDHHHLTDLIAPMSPAPPAAYGPPPRAGMPPVQNRNPLPPPPRDVYTSSPYNAVVNFPQTTALLTASFSKDIPQKSKGIFGKSKGLLRSLSSKKKEEPRIQFVPVNVGANGFRSDAGLNRSMAPSSSGSISAPPPPVAMSVASAPPPPIVQMPVPEPAEPPPPIIPEPRPDVPPSVIRITFDNEYRDFCNHSFHRVMYNNQTYDTAMHLFEAMKFLPDNPNIADSIRLCKNIGDVFPLSANFAQYQRSDWGDVHTTILEEVLYHKYGQNPDVRNLLLNTGSAELVYSDPNDSYWSEGPDGQGQNHLGKALMRVRERLKAMGYKK